jgi:DNA-directed RNA polymerase specialized sigma24 family protein
LPWYAYLRRCGYPSDQAKDLTQEFFVRVWKADTSIALTRRRAASGRLF